MAAPAFDALINTANPNAAEEPNVDMTALCITPEVPIVKRSPLTNSTMSALGNNGKSDDEIRAAIKR